MNPNSAAARRNHFWAGPDPWPRVHRDRMVFGGRFLKQNKHVVRKRWASATIDYIIFHMAPSVIV